jgi:hypothetical protein
LFGSFEITSIRLYTPLRNPIFLYEPNKNCDQSLKYSRYFFIYAHYIWCLISTCSLSEISQVQLNMETIIRCVVLVLVTMVFGAHLGGKFSVGINFIDWLFICCFDTTLCGTVGHICTESENRRRSQGVACCCHQAIFFKWGTFGVI